jgi:hypothetical protein
MKTKIRPVLQWLWGSLILFLLPSFSHAQGDGTQNDHFIFQITAPLSLAGKYVEGSCGYGVTQNWGGEITSDLSGPVAWAYDVTGDSLNCDSTLTDLTGKIALVRRGDCEFSLKAYHAQQAGAAAVLILNHFNGTGEDECTVMDMGAGTSGSLVTIPVIFLSRVAGEPIAGGLVAGLSVEVAFTIPSLSHPLAAYHFATPVQHVDTLRHIAVRFRNKEDVEINDVVLKADIQRPDGPTESLQTTLSAVPAGVDTLVYFPAYLPPAVLGEFVVTFSNSRYSGSTDTVARRFVHTPFTFASDNFSTAAAPNLSKWEKSFYQQTAALYFTGSVPDKATHLTFGLANVDTVYVPEPGANIIGVVIYDADANTDGIIDLVDNFQDLIILSLVVYEFNGDEPPNAEIHIPLVDLENNPYVELKSKHPYYASIFYNGEAAANGRHLHFSRSSLEGYVDFPTTPLLLGSFFPNGWADGTVWQRLHLQGYSAVKPVRPQGLDPARVAVFPNPASETLQVELEGIKGPFKVSLHDWQGRVLDSKHGEEAEGLSIEFPVRHLPAGTYFLMVKTREGSCLKKMVRGKI